MQVYIFQLRFQGSVNIEGGNPRNAVTAETTVWCSEVTSGINGLKKSSP